MEPSPTQKKKPKLLLFDVYETLLDMEMLEKKTNAILNSKRGYLYWFELFMQYCFVDNSLDEHHSFASIAKATLNMAGRNLGTHITDNQADEIVELLNHLPLNEGITEALSHLYDQDFRIAALTNASQQIIQNRMENTGLISYFEEVLSAEQAKKYKPAKEVYLWAAEKLSLTPSEVLFVTSHSWDIAGAANAGMQTVFVNQGKETFYPLFKEPDFRVKNVEQLALQMKQAYP
ncbi:MAG: haloacid dehalogenase type II [Chitinophagaceae bacterium]|nr:MAG: haloacid dehalogenase type II [Chitinophagaceae bacterium]